jgi:hypothetical protein
MFYNFILFNILGACCVGVVGFDTGKTNDELCGTGHNETVSLFTGVNKSVASAKV